SGPMTPVLLRPVAADSGPQWWANKPASRQSVGSTGRCAAVAGTPPSMNSSCILAGTAACADASRTTDRTQTGHRSPSPTLIRPTVVGVGRDDAENAVVNSLVQP